MGVFSLNACESVLFVRLWEGFRCKHLDVCVFCCCFFLRLGVFSLYTSGSVFLYACRSVFCTPVGVFFCTPLGVFSLYACRSVFFASP